MRITLQECADRTVVALMVSERERLVAKANEMRAVPSTSNFYRWAQRVLRDVDALLVEFPA